MIRFWITIALVVSTIHSQAQSFAGDWNGVVKTKYMDLPIIAHFIKDDGNWLGTLDSPEQNAWDIPADTVEVWGDSIYWTISKLRITFKGKLIARDSFRGQFKQGRRSQIIHFYRTNKKTSSTYLKPIKSKELQILNPQAEITISATLTYPAKGKNFPTVVLISGSGPQDRDASMFGQKPFKNLAEKLTRSGFAVVRFDERGVGKSSGNYASATTKDLTSDVVHIVNHLAQEKKLHPKKIGLLGHSEGSIIAAAVAAQIKDVSFVISMGGPGMPFDTLMLLQYRMISEAAGAQRDDIARSIALNKAIFKAARSKMDSTALAKEVKILVSQKLIKDSLPISADSLNTMIRSATALYNQQINNPWMKYALNINPLNYWKKVSCPVYILNGYLDLQVPSSPNVLLIQDELARSGNYNVQIKGYPGLNHLFQKAKVGTIDEYGSGKVIINYNVQNDIIDWLNGLFVKK